jgi:hypothetical protein
MFYSPAQNFMQNVYLIQVATYILYNLSKEYAQMNIISLIKKPVSVTA